MPSAPTLRRRSRSIRRRSIAAGAEGAHVSEVWGKGGAGGEELARAVLAAAEKPKSFSFTYEVDWPIKQKIEAIATQIYGADGVDYLPAGQAADREVHRARLRQLAHLHGQDAMARAAENQTREINAATESIVSMAASIEEVSGNAERSSDVARHSVDVAHKGGEAVRRTIDGMNAIRETIQDTSKRIKRLGESSQEIGNIVELINDIAEQTNILALNASIQASMAGEAGRGFAVVADEVQRLAERSTNATRQIEVLVRTIQADTKEAVVSMERSTTDVVGGALLAENAGAALDEIEQVSNQIASLVQNISSSARQQAGAAADVTRRTKRLGEISQQTGKATTATAAAISKLSEFASQLRKSVAGFTLPKEAMPAQTLHTTPAAAAPSKPAAKKASAG